MIKALKEIGCGVMRS